MRPYLACFPFQFDWDRMAAEVLPYKAEMFESGPSRRYKEEFAPDVDVTYFEGTEVVKGSVHGYSVYSLTHSPDLKGSGYGLNHLRPMMGAYDWEWRPGLEYTKKVVDSLPFEWYSIVKVIYLPAGGAGVRHTDSTFDMNDSITLELMQGGTVLNIYPQTSDEVVHPTTRCFFFDDSVLHGVDTPTSDRLLLRVHGRLTCNALEQATPSSKRFL